MEPEQILRQQRARRAAAYGGLLAAFVFLAVSWLTRSQLAVLTVVEVTQQGLIQLIPGQLFSAALDLLYTAAKPALFLTLIGATLFAGGIIGRIFGQWRTETVQRGETSRAVTEGILAGVVVYLFLAVIWLPGFGAGFLGSTLARDLSAAVMAYLLPSLAFGVVLGLSAPWFYRLENRQAASAAPVDRSRRRLIALGGVIAVAAAAGGALATRAVLEAGAIAGDAWARLSTYVTPVGRFYTISKNFFDPIVRADTWRLEIGGMVDRPYVLTLDEIRALPATEDYNTLMCISNEVGGGLIGNARWKGTSLAAILERAGVQAGAVDVKFTCADDYTDSITIEKALQPDVRLVYEMNGQPLPDQHGAPARLVVPGIYGMKNVKWVRSIEVVGVDYKGFWMRQGWDDAAPYKLFSRFDLPAARSTVALGQVPVGGVAFSGDRGISRVEISDDNGASWKPAAIEAPRGRYTWVIWRTEWIPPQAGSYRLSVRCFDGTGTPQTPAVTSPFPSGATGYHTIQVTVQG